MLTGPAGNTEVGQHDWVDARPAAAQQDVRRLDVTVQNVTAVGIVERIGNRGHDVHDLFGWDSGAVLLRHQPESVGAVDELHGDPQLAVAVAAVIDRDDVGVAQCRHHLGFLVEPLAVLRVMTDLGAEHLQRIPARQARMLGQIHLAHATRAEHAQDRVAGECLAVSERHRGTPVRVPRPGRRPSASPAHPRSTGPVPQPRRG